MKRSSDDSLPPCQILSGEDAELLAFASLTKARALLLASEADADRGGSLAA